MMRRLTVRAAKCPLRVKQLVLYPQNRILIVHQPIEQARSLRLYSNSKKRKLAARLLAIFLPI